MHASHTHSGKKHRKNINEGAVQRCEPSSSGARLQLIKLAGGRQPVGTLEGGYTQSHLAAN